MCRLGRPYWDLLDAADLVMDLSAAWSGFALFEEDVESVLAELRCRIAGTEVP
jgi:hypothetical protein